MATSARKSRQFSPAKQDCRARAEIIRLAGVVRNRAARQLLDGCSVSVAKNANVMRGVASDDVGECARAYREATRDAHASPPIVIDLAGERERRRSCRSKRVNELGDRQAVEVGHLYIWLLIEAGKRRLVSARDPQHSIREDAFSVGDVANRFLHAPLVGSVALHCVSFAERS